MYVSKYTLKVLSWHSVHHFSAVIADLQGMKLIRNYLSPSWIPCRAFHSSRVLSLSNKMCSTGKLQIFYIHKIKYTYHWGLCTPPLFSGWNPAGLGLEFFFFWLIISEILWLNSSVNSGKCLHWTMSSQRTICGLSMNCPVDNQWLGIINIQNLINTYY